MVQAVDNCCVYEAGWIRETEAWETAVRNLQIHIALTNRLIKKSDGTFYALKRMLPQ
jgi:hypothetical protein